MCVSWLSVFCDMIGPLGAGVASDADMRIFVCCSLETKRNSLYNVNT